MRLRTTVSLAAAAALTGLTTLALPGPTASALPPADVTYTDTSQALVAVVPADVCEITFTAIGGQGGSHQLNTGGRGGRVVATVTVSPGSSYTVRVGQEAPLSGAGGVSGGSPSGGAFGSGTSYQGGGGGGASSVTLGNASSPVIIAAGGGGAAQDNPGGADGGDGAATGAAGASPPGAATGGGGGTQNAGGAGGAATGLNGNAGGSGTAGLGGAGAIANQSGGGASAGGGGGGLYGGGGGGAAFDGAEDVAGGGGGGSNLAPMGAVSTTAATGGDGSVVAQFLACAVGVPGVPTAVSATAGNGQAAVAFTPPVATGGSAITQYTATSDPGGITGTCNASPCTVTGLTNGTPYTFTVTATNSTGPSAPGGPSNPVTPATAPDPPAIGTVTPGNAQASVAFTAPVSDGGSAITQYTATSDPGGITGTCNASPCAVTGLTNGTPYTFTVTATNGKGTSLPSGASAPVTPVAAPGAPSIGTVTPASTQATVAFSPPGSNGGSAITQYTATSNPGGITATCTASPCVVTGLTNGTPYTFTVTATNTIGTSGPSGASSPVTPATVPGAPTIGTATPGDGQVSVAFSAPASDGGSAITQYTATSTPDGLTATCGAGPCVVTGLTNGVSYTFTVHATNTTGSGDESAQSGPVVPIGPPGAPAVTGVTTGAGQVSVAFTPPTSTGGTAITGYTATSAPGGVAGTCAASPCVVTGLTNGTAYTFTVTATNIAGTSGPSGASGSVTPRTVPSAPAITTVAPGNGQATVTFTPGATGGSPVTAWEVSTDDGATWQPLTTAPAGSDLTGTVTGLTNGTLYQVKVRATNVAGTGPAGTASPVTPAPVPPAPPTGLTAQPRNAAAVLTFTPGADGGSAITGYELSLDGGTSWVPFPVVANTGTVTGLVNDVPATVTLRARNVAGPSSGVAVTVTPLAPPAAPTTVAAAAATSAITVTWAAPAGTAGAPITGYTAVASPGPATCKTLVTDPDPTRCVLGAQAGVAYTVTVVTDSASGASAPSAPSNEVAASVPVAPPTPPATELTLTTDQGDITTAEPGERIVVIGEGFAPHSTATVTIYSTPVPLATVTTDAAGNFSVAVTVPPGLAAGAHTVIAQGADPNGLPRTMKLEVTVAEDLPVTGPRTLTVFTTGLLSIVGGVLLRLAARRRDRTPLLPPGTAYA